MASDAAENKTWQQKRCFHVRMMFSQSLMLADSALKLHYASVIFVDPVVHVHET